MLDALGAGHSISGAMRPRLASKRSPNGATAKVSTSPYLLAAALSVCCSCAFFLAACGEQSPDLEERIAHLQKELDRTQNELKSATQALEASKEEMARLKSAPANIQAQNATPAPLPVQRPVPSRENLEASYIAEAKVLKKKLQDRLKEFTLGSFTLHNVILPDNQFPISSWISLAFQAGDGKRYRLDFPVKADLTGKWIFPDPEEIGRRVADSKNVTPTSDTSQTPAPQTAPKETTTSTSTSTVPADSTVVIQWPNSSPAPQAPQAPAAPPAPKAPQEPNKPNTQTSSPKPQTSPPQGPKQSIPADRDVLIRF
jgi:hypothetical protein